MKIATMILWCSVLGMNCLYPEDIVRELTVRTTDLRTLRNRLLFRCSAFTAWISDTRNDIPLFEPDSFSGTTCFGFVSAPFVLAPVRSGGILRDAYSPDTRTIFPDVPGKPFISWTGWGGPDGLFCCGALLPGGNLDVLVLFPRWIVFGKPPADDSPRLPFFSGAIRGSIGEAGVSFLFGEAAGIISEVPPDPPRAECGNLSFYRSSPLFPGGTVFHAGGRTIMHASLPPVSLTASLSCLVSKSCEPGLRTAGSVSLALGGVFSAKAGIAIVSPAFMTPSGKYSQVTDFARLEIVLEPFRYVRFRQGWERSVLRPDPVPFPFRKTEETWEGSTAGRIGAALVGVRYEYRPRWSVAGKVRDSGTVAPSLEFKFPSWSAGTAVEYVWGSEKEPSWKIIAAADLSFRGKRNEYPFLKPACRFSCTLNEKPAYEWSVSLDFGTGAISGYIRAGTRKPVDLVPEPAGEPDPSSGLFSYLSLSIGFLITDRISTGERETQQWDASVFSTEEDEEADGGSEP